MTADTVLKCLFGLLCLATAAALFIGTVYSSLFPMIVYDYNFRIMHDILSPQDANSITRTVRGVARLISWPLVATNICWIVAFFILRAMKLRESDRAQL